VIPLWWIVDERRIASLNPEINPGKYEHLCQVENLNSGGYVLLKGTQPTDLRSVRRVFSVKINEKQYFSRVQAEKIFMHAEGGRRLPELAED
jgi:hypothetical protein